MSGLTDAQRKFYEDALEQTKTEIQDLEGQIQVELGKVRRLMVPVMLRRTRCCPGSYLSEYTEDQSPNAVSINRDELQSVKDGAIDGK
jgi:hypothetical protein